MPRTFAESGAIIALWRWLAGRYKGKMAEHGREVMVQGPGEDSSGRVGRFSGDSQSVCTENSKGVQSNAGFGGKAKSGGLSRVDNQADDFTWWFSSDSNRGTLSVVAPQKNAHGRTRTARLSRIEIVSMNVGLPREVMGHGLAS